MTKKELKAQIKANPGFATWVKGKPELYKKIKNDTKAATIAFGSWKKAKSRKDGLKRIAETYRGMVDQVEELHSLLQRVDSLVGNVRNMSQTLEELGYEKEAASKDPSKTVKSNKT